MADTSLLEKVIQAATAALEGEGEGNILVNLDILESSLLEAGVPVKRLNRGALIQELSLVREEIGRERTRSYHAQGEAKEQIEQRLGVLHEREEGLTSLLWPAGAPR